MKYQPAHAHKLVLLAINIFYIYIIMKMIYYDWCTIKYNDNIQLWETDITLVTTCHLLCEKSYAVLRMW